MIHTISQQQRLQIEADKEVAKFNYNQLRAWAIHGLNVKEMNGYHNKNTAILDIYTQDHFVAVCHTANHYDFAEYKYDEPSWFTDYDEYLCDDDYRETPNIGGCVRDLTKTHTLDTESNGYHLLVNLGVFKRLKK